MLVAQIPKQVLILSATYEEFLQGDGFEIEDGFKPSVMLSNVLLQPSGTSTQPNIVRSNTGEAMLYNYTFFYDVVNSLANGEFEFKEKSRITFDGKELIVEKVNPIYAFNLHHYEVFCL